MQKEKMMWRFVCNDGNNYYVADLLIICLTFASIITVGKGNF
jgi:hypothetical protein